MKTTKKVLVNFQIGRGGRFNNQGHLSFLNVGTKAKACVESDNIIRYENEAEIIKDLETEQLADTVRDQITDLDCQIEGDNYTEFCEKYGDLGKLELHDCNGNVIGEYQNGECEYNYNIDNDYDTTYGKLISDLSELTESELEAVIEASNNYEIGYVIGVDFDNRFQILNQSGEVFYSGSRLDDVELELNSMNDDDDENHGELRIYDTILKEFSIL